MNAVVTSVLYVLLKYGRNTAKVFREKGKAERGTWEMRMR
jgi:hypothetical protein